MYLHKKRRRRLPVSLPRGRFLGGPVKVMDAETMKLKRWETPRGKLMAIMEGSRLVIRRVGSQMRYQVRNNELVGKT